MQKSTVSPHKENMTTAAKAHADGKILGQLSSRVANPAGRFGLASPEKPPPQKYETPHEIGMQIA
ncbi:MAG: hypothetical protein WCO04_08100 [Pseudomonadota bacterium]